MKFPVVAQAAFYCELEDRLIAVVMAKQEKVIEEYRHVRRGQQLSKLEARVYEMNEKLVEQNLPHLTAREHPF